MNKKGNLRTMFHLSGITTCCCTSEKGHLQVKPVISNPVIKMKRQVRKTEKSRMRMQLGTVGKKLEEFWN